MSTLRTFFERLGFGAEKYDPLTDPHLVPLYLHHERSEKLYTKAQQFFAVTPLTETIFGLTDTTKASGDE